VSSFTELVEKSVQAGEPAEMAPTPAPALAGQNRWLGWLGTLLLYLASFTVAFALSALFVALTGNSPRDVVTAMYDGSLADGSAIGQTIDEATPLLIVALGTIICTKAGIFNIGQEGQLIIGAMCGAFVALDVHGPNWIILILTLLAAAAGGAAWAGISAVLKYWRGVDVVISTLLLIFVAFQLVTWAVTTSGVLQESAVPGSVLSPESNQLAPGVQLARIGQYPDFNVGTGCFLALALAIVVQVAMTRTRWGFRIRLLGMNRDVARSTGVRDWRTGGGALALSGAFAGLAGGVMLTGSVFRIQAGFSNNVGFQGLLAALVAQGSALLAIPVSLFFGALRSGGGFLASTGVPRYLVDIVQALLVLAAIFPPVFLAVLRRRRARVRAAAQAAVS
jgi:ABC-type uncharacterized transport system permease subunit